MTKRIIWVMTILLLVFTSACDQIVSNTTPDEGQVVVSDAEYATLSALATEAQKTPDGILRLPTPTATLEAPAGNEQPADTGNTGGETAETPNVPAGISIAITSIEETGPGTATVNWTAEGNFPSGFKVVYTTDERKPTFPEDSAVYASSYVARSASISGTPGKIYFVRVCRYLDGACDVYSNLGIIAFLDMSPTKDLAMLATQTALAKTPTKTPFSAVAKTGTATPMITITDIVYKGSNKALITWEATGSFPYGFKIAFSPSTSTPTYGVNEFYAIDDGKTRSAYVSYSGGKVYYRVCRVVSSGCDNYSNSFAFTYPSVEPTTDPASMNITSIMDVSPGVVNIDWTASGSFPNGFKVLYSKTYTNPTLSANDGYIYLNDAAARTTDISGLTPGTKYYFRVCKYYDGACTVYSTTTTLTLAADPAQIVVTSITNDSTASATISWTASGFFDEGFYILYNASGSATTADDYIVVSNGSTRSATLTEVPGTHYYYRICRVESSACDTATYSNDYEFTFSDTPTDSSLNLTLDAADTTNRTVTWTAGGFPESYYVMVGSSDSPTYPAGVYNLSIAGSSTNYVFSASLGDPNYLAPATTYYVRLCKWTSALGGYCSAYSNTVSTTPN